VLEVEQDKATRVGVLFLSRQAGLASARNETTASHQLILNSVFFNINLNSPYLNNQRESLAVWDGTPNMNILLCHYSQYLG
jgi:hypothetical protein